MTRDEFSDLLSSATVAAMTFARRYVENDLPVTVRYQACLNQSHDLQATVHERLYPSDDGREHDCLTAEQVIDLLLREGRCPEWIDISVTAKSATDTRMKLLCCGRFTDDYRLMYYTARGLGPFGVKSPDLPPDFREGVKFRVPIVPTCAL